ncbi:MAG: tRNA 2-thiouridine(34) synthase MnmA [Candidatus Gracilibacteria bacterium]
MKTKGKVLVAMSGGVDSSVTAALLKQQGYDCVGAHMNLWKDPTVKHLPTDSLAVVRSVCQKLGIPSHSIHLEETFKEKVVDFFLEGFKKGETPNPCVRCNKTIKFGILFEKMEELGCDFLATGHYAHLTKSRDGFIHLSRGKDIAKDQTYFLYNLDQAHLKRIKFPLGTYTKPQVRELAKKFGLTELENRQESQDVCFYPDKTTSGFLKRYLKPGEDFKTGKIMDSQGKVLGEHQGLPFYTIGQRKGIGVGGGPALYVNKMDKIKNVLVVGGEEELIGNQINVRELNFISGTMPDENTVLHVRVRGQGKFIRAELKKSGSNYQVRFLEPEYGIMPGQSVVFYKGKELLGGGIMCYN